MDGNKPKQQREKPVDKNTLKLNDEHSKQKVVETDETELDKEFQMPDYRPQALFTRKQVSRAKKRKLRKIAYKSKRINRIRSKQ